MFKGFLFATAMFVCMSYVLDAHEIVIEKGSALDWQHVTAIRRVSRERSYRILYRERWQGILLGELSSFYTQIFTDQTHHLLSAKLKKDDGNTCYLGFMIYKIVDTKIWIECSGYIIKDLAVAVGERFTQYLQEHYDNLPIHLNLEDY